MTPSKFNFLLLALFFMSAPIASFAQSISGKLLDEETQKVIPFANVQIGKDHGALANAEGDFSLDVSSYTDKDTLYFSSLGYQLRAIVLKNYSDSIVYLTPQAEKLDAVFIQNRKLSPREIIDSVHQNLSRNHHFSNRQFTVFRRNKSENKLRKLDINTKKAKNILDNKTRKKFNTSIDSFTTAAESNRSIAYSSILGKATLSDSLKMKLKKASKLFNREKNLNMNDFSMQVYEKLARHIRSSHTYHIKSGLFNIGDSIDLSKGFLKKDSLKVDSVFTKSIKPDLSSLLQQASFQSEKSSISLSIGTAAAGGNIPIEFITQPDVYQYHVEGIITMSNDFAYQLSFKPDSNLFGNKGKYKGMLYISTSDYGILRSEFQLAEGEIGAKFNMKFLLGVKFQEKKQAGIVIYQKRSEFYEPQYIQLSGLRYAYMKRNFTMKENTDNRKDRIKMKMQLALEFDGTYQDEWLFSEQQTISSEDFASFKENKGIQEHEQTEFDSDFWEGEKVIAPTQAVREYNGNN